MRAELFYFDGCPGWQVAEQRLAEALRTAGRDDVRVNRRLVETPEEAERLQFIGSPTIRIDGVDPFATGDERYGLACRIYDSPEGRVTSPSTAQLLGVIEALSWRAPE